MGPFSVFWGLNLLLEVHGLSHVQVDRTALVDASQPIPESFVSFSIELSSFPNFAGNISNPNLFSYNLLSSIGNLTGTHPIIRVGGNTQDYALYDPNLQVATNGTMTAASQDYPTVLTIGKSFFESYSTWPGVQFIHGFNLGKNNTAGYQTLLETVPLACNALQGGKLAYWELGNEPDLYKTSAQGVVRPANWAEKDYVNEWLNKTRLVGQLVEKNCPNQAYGYIAPSFAGTHNSLDPVKTWHSGLNADGNTKLISSHNYIAGATQPGVTLQRTLMNHTSIVNSISSQIDEARLLANYSIPFILGETNSLYNEGAPGLSNAFGAALWGVDFNLWCASQGIKRTHMHIGTDYRYASWQPIQTNKTSIGTKAPFYGNIAVAAMLGNLKVHNTSIANLPLPSDERQAAYVAYEDGKLARVAIINMIEYNYTASGTGSRPAETYSFTLSGLNGTSARVLRLMANGSNAITGITFDGYSYNYELNRGQPVLLSNVTRGERAVVEANGTVAISVPYSSMAMLNFLES